MTEKKQKHKFTCGLIMISIFIMMLLFFSSCTNKTENELSREDKQKKEGIPVEIVTVKKGNIIIAVLASGELKADDIVTLNTNNSGTIQDFKVKEGDYVKADQIIAVIEPNDLQSQLSQAQSALNSSSLRLSQAQNKAILQTNQVEGAIKQAQTGVKSAEAQYREARVALATAKSQLSIVEEGARKQEISMAQSAVDQAEANFKQAKVDLGRMQRLYDKGVISKQQLDTAKLQYDVTEAQSNSAVHRLDLTEEGSRSQEKETARQEVQIVEEKVEVAQAALDQAKETLKLALDNRMQITVAQQEVVVAQASVDQDRENLSIMTRKLQKSFVKAPISGYVTKRYVNQGEYTSGPGATKIIDIFDPRSLYFEAVVSETDIAKINRSMDVNITVDSLPDKIFPGTVKEIVPQAGVSRQFSVKIKVEGSGIELKPGMFARGQIILAEHKNVPVISKDAVKDKEGKHYVYTIKDLYAVEKEVTTGPSMNGSVEIIKGITEGEKVVYSGFVKNGDLVKIIHEE